jgi:LmbE family N-acetylglucosaminyl deacetylase
MINSDMMFYGRKVCFIGAHPDDIEIGAGALIAHIAPQTEVFCLTLSDNQKNPDLKNVVTECRRSLEVLGVAQDHAIIGSFETRRFPEQRQDILEYLIQFNQSQKPDIVFTHSKADIHQDHAAVTEEVLRAFRGTSVFGFDVIRSSYGFFPNFLVEVCQEDVDLKIKALAEYATYRSKYYFDPEATRAILVRNGVIAQRPFAEGFETLRIIGSFDTSQK